MKDIQQICLNGHQITSFVNFKPEEMKSYCSDCGAETITTCPYCGKRIPGGEYITDDYGLDVYTSAKVPDYCEKCGKPFPWTNKEFELKEPNNNVLSETSNQNVFIVHGHNTEIKDQVEQHISDSGFNPIILHKQANLGKTIIEKVEHYGGKSRFAIILCTADDLGCKYLSRPASKTQVFNKKSMTLASQEIQEYKIKIFDSLQKRARQNVVLEFGYFIGLLGRENVIMLYEEGVELPSDMDGFIHIKFDKDWKENLNKEIRAISG